MSEKVVIRYCSPTLAGLKTGSLFSYSYEERDEVYDFLRKLNRSLRYKGVRCIPLRMKNNKALIYVFRPSMLRVDFKNKNIKEMLKKQGYCTNNYDKCLIKLMKRLENKEDFPHEIGFFLGYPVEDVIGFIENKATCAKCAGYWKVYGDENKAIKLFKQYKECTKFYEQQLEEGKTIVELTV